MLLQRHWAHRELFLAAAVPALISALFTFGLRWVIKEPAKASVATAEVYSH